MSHVLTGQNKTIKDGSKYRQQRHRSGRRTLRRRVGGCPEERGLIGQCHTAQIRLGRPLSADIRESVTGTV